MWLLSQFDILSSFAFHTGHFKALASGKHTAHTTLLLHSDLLLPLSQLLPRQ